MTPGEEHIVFFHAYALAVHQWSMVERAMFEVLAACVRAEDVDMVGFGFVSIDNFRSKLSFVDAMLKHKVTSNGHLADWDLLRERLRSAASLRNSLADSTPSSLGQIKARVGSQGREIRLPRLYASAI